MVAQLRLRGLMYDDRMSSHGFARGVDWNGSIRGSMEGVYVDKDTKYAPTRNNVIPILSLTCNTVCMAHDCLALSTGVN